jgi:hypothetical protein
MNTPEREEDGCAYTFMAREKELGLFRLRCEHGATVAVAREQVARHLRYQAKLVQLLFAGRVMRDPLVLDNLDIGDGIIVVHVRDHHNPQFWSLNP